MISRSVFFPAPAKLNLMLHIVGRREDGYHLLQTVFQFLDFSDQLGFSLRNDGEIRRVTRIDSVAEEHDLVVRAAKLLAQQLPGAPGVDIEIRKKIPMGAGLGGGSSDAATVLLALNKLWGAGFSREQLARLGLQLGADVPVFVNGLASWAEGVGETLEPVELSRPWYLVVNPGCHVSTAEVFSDSDLTRSSPLTTIADFLAHGGRNDCESVVVKRHPQIARAMQWLNGFASARLTGTGACIFASFEVESQAQAVLNQLPVEYTGFVARGLNQSPVLSFL